jgi:hypothetical protein
MLFYLFFILNAIYVSECRNYGLSIVVVMIVSTFQTQTKVHLLDKESNERVGDLIH